MAQRQDILKLVCLNLLLKFYILLKLLIGVFHTMVVVQKPNNLPVKFPTIAQGAEGIAVGLSTKVLPHNELIDASIKILKGSLPCILIL
jgi:hypothetical protein